MYMAMWTLWMMIMFNGEPLHIPLAEFITREACVEARDELIIEMLKTYPDDVTSRYYCEPKITSET